ncbi:MAG: trehalose-phosphatase [Chromatiales bacterium]
MDRMHAAPETTANHVPAFAPHWAFFLDVDGTLLELAAHPDEVAIGPLLIPTLQALQERARSPVALVSGRSLADLDRLFEPLRLAAAGQHGAERRDAQGRVHRAEARDAGLEDAKMTLLEFSRRYPGIAIEDKGLTLAIHYRRVPSLAAEVERVVSLIAETLGSDYSIQSGKMVHEIRPGQRHKGRAIAEFLTEPPFAGRLPVFIGDDVTDEHGFELINGLGGHSIKAGPGPSVATWRLASVADVIAWLQRYVEACEH